MSNTLDIVLFNWVCYKQQFGYITVWILCSEIRSLIPPLFFSYSIGSDISVLLLSVIGINVLLSVIGINVN